MLNDYGKFLSLVVHGLILVSIKLVFFNPLFRRIISGPLLYHFEDIPNENSFELSYADLRTVILSFGFQIEVYLSNK
jgi:hypothetical protein